MLRRSQIRRKEEIKGLGALCLTELCALLSILKQKEENTRACLPGRGRVRASCGQRGRGSRGAGAVRAGEVDGEKQAGLQGMILHADSRLLTCTGLMESKERSPILTIQNEGGGEREVGGATGFLR